MDLCALIGSPQARQADATIVLAWARMAERASVERRRAAVWPVTVTAADSVILRVVWALIAASQAGRSDAVKRGLNRSSTIGGYPSGRGPRRRSPRSPRWRIGSTCWRLNGRGLGGGGWWVKGMLTDTQRQTILAAICIALLVAVASLAASSGTQSVSLPPTAPTGAPKPSENPTTTNNAANSSYSDPIAIFGDFVRGYKDEITAISTALLAVITAFLAIIARGQYTTTRAQLRAYVFVGSATCVGTPNGRSYIAIQISNTGQTPAYELTITSRRIFMNYPIMSPLDRSGERLYLGVIGPGFRASHILNDDLFRSEEVDRLKAGTSAVLIYGRIEYRDAFRQARWTDYTFIYNAIFPARENNQIASYTSGNDAT